MPDETQTDGTQLRTSLSVEMKVNLGNYESASAFVSIQNVAPDTSAEEIDACLAQGALAWEALKTDLRAKVKELRSGRW